MTDRRAVSDLIETDPLELLGRDLKALKKDPVGWVCVGLVASLLVGAAVIIGSATGASAATTGSSVHLADSNLTKLISLDLRLPESHALTPTDLRKLTMLGAYGPNMHREKVLIGQIKTLDGLQDARWQNIEFVNLDGAYKLTSIEGLASEDHIMGVSISGAKRNAEGIVISDGARTLPLKSVKALDGKNSLVELDISQTSVSSVKGLTNGGSRSLTSFIARGDKALTSLTGLEWAGGWTAPLPGDATMLDVSNTNVAGLQVLVGWNPTYLIISGDPKLTSNDLAPITPAYWGTGATDVTLTADSSQLVGFEPATGVTIAKPSSHS